MTITLFCLALAGLGAVQWMRAQRKTAVRIDRAQKRAHLKLVEKPKDAA